MKPGPHELAQQHPQKGVAIYLVMHQMTSCPREVGSRTINQLALTFGTLLSSQRTDAHPWKSLDRLRGNLIYVTGWARQLQIVSALPFPTPTGDARVTASALTDVFAGVCPWAVQLPETFRSGRCAVPLGAWTKLRGHCGSRQTRRSSRVSVINGLNRCRWAGRIGAGQVRPAQGSHSDAVHIKPSRVRSRPQAPVPPGLRRLGWDAEPGPLRAD